MERTTAACVFYDGNCPWCSRGARWFRHVLGRRGISVAPLQAPEAKTLLHVSDDELLVEMRLRLADGRVFGGAAAVVEIARRIWWARPVWALSRAAGAMDVMDAAYRWGARHRGCAAGACAAPPRRNTSFTGVWPLVVFSAGAWLARPYLPPWGFMCVMAVALYAGCKWLTYASARAAGVSTRPGRIAAYLLAWPGMDAQTFLSRDARAAVAPSIAEWIAAALKVAFGALVTWTMVPRALPEHPLLAGWLGMTGLICMVHFGTFHALSLMWRSVGTDAAPVMRSPLRSTSLAEFWGRRWNTAFHELAARFAFRPLRTEFGLAAATFATFVVSGLVHELVISVPAGGGYGLPTAYFVLQGVGIAGERAPLGRRLGLGAGWRGWTFTMVMAAGPAYWLFAPPFVHVVALPLLAAIGAR